MNGVVDMRTPSILDVLRAVISVAAAHPEVDAWWYAPPRRLRLRGELPGAASAPPLEVVVEAAAGAEVDEDHLAAELAPRLPGQAVAVRPHRGAGEERRLFRLVSRHSPARSASAAEALARGAAALQPAEEEGRGCR